MYQSICSEIDCLLKEVCKQLEGESKAGKIGAYCKVIQKYFKYFNNETVYFYKSRIELEPWKNWSDINAPTWWTMYNKVKHHRMETDSTTKRQYYKFANLGNVLNALAALYIVEEYYVYSYNYSKEIYTAKDMDEIRWKNVYGGAVDYAYEVWKIKDFLAARKLFLDEVWAKQREISTVCFVPEDSGRRYVSVLKGERLERLPEIEPETQDGDRIFDGWYAEDGTFFDDTTPVTKDMTVYARSHEISEEE